MSNRSQVVVEGFAGLDVSAREISVARRQGKEEKSVVASFANNASGHKALLAYLVLGTERVRVCLEASGHYSLVNPRRARRFAESLGERSKTDPVDARVLCEYAARMPWMACQPPSSLALRLRAITRAIEALGVIHTQEKNREHALASSQALPAMVIQEMQRHQRYLEHRMERQSRGSPSHRTGSRAEPPLSPHANYHRHR